MLVLVSTNIQLVGEQNTLKFSHIFICFARSRVYLCAPSRNFQLYFVRCKTCMMFLEYYHKRQAAGEININRKLQSN